MTVDERANTRRASGTVSRAIFVMIVGVLAGCGPAGNPPDVSNPQVVGGQKLAFAYFERCINPIFFTQIGVNTCGAAGCHGPGGTGGALKVIPNAALVDVTNPANTPAVIKQTDIYKNFVSAQGQTLLADPSQSRLINKPLVRGVLHGGGQIFTSDQDPLIKLMEYWITHPAPLGQDEFSTTTYSMFTPADPNAGTCNTQ